MTVLPIDSIFVFGSVSRTQHLTGPAGDKGVRRMGLVLGRNLHKDYYATKAN